MKNLTHISESEILTRHHCIVLPTGSNYICNPPVEDTDIDFVVFCKITLFASLDLNLSAAGYKCAIREDFEQSLYSMFSLNDNFVSFRKDKINLIVTTNNEYFNKYVLATEVCKQLNLTDKAERILLFTTILTGTFQGLDEIRQRLSKLDKGK